MPMGESVVKLEDLKQKNIAKSKMQQTPQRYLENIISLIQLFHTLFSNDVVYISDGYFRKQSPWVRVHRRQSSSPFISSMYMNGVFFLSSSLRKRNCWTMDPEYILGFILELIKKSDSENHLSFYPVRNSQSRKKIEMEHGPCE
jgi:hypothetical protein